MCFDKVECDENLPFEDVTDNEVLEVECDEFPLEEVRTDEKLPFEDDLPFEEDVAHDKDLSFDELEDNFSSRSCVSSSGSKYFLKNSSK